MKFGESSRYIPRDRSHMRTTELDLNSGAVTADARAKRFCVYHF